MDLLRLNNAVLGYRSPVIGPLNLSVALGDRIGIWGPNGCGKSTLLNYFCGRSRLISGTIDISTNTTIAYQPQYPIRPQQLPITGLEYLALMDAATDQLPQRLTPFLNKRVDKLSGGQFQILSTWANLASQGQLVLLDEPTNNLDPDAIELLAETVLSMPSDHGLIVVSHEREFINTIANQVIEIS